MTNFAKIQRQKIKIHSSSSTHALAEAKLKVVLYGGDGISALAAKHKLTEFSLRQNLDVAERLRFMSQVLFGYDYVQVTHTIKAKGEVGDVQNFVREVAGVPAQAKSDDGVFVWR